MFTTLLTAQTYQSLSAGTAAAVWKAGTADGHEVKW